MLRRGAQRARRWPTGRVRPSSPRGTSMRWLSLALAILLSAAASPALAVKTIALDPAHQAVYQEIGAALDPGHSYALVLGISDFDNPGWRHLSGVGPEVAEVSLALE